MFVQPNLTTRLDAIFPSLTQREIGIMLEITEAFAVPCGAGRDGRTPHHHGCASGAQAWRQLSMASNHLIISCQGRFAGMMTKT